MIYSGYYDSPLGKIVITGEENTLTGVWFEGQKADVSFLKEKTIEHGNFEVLHKTMMWLDAYFAGEKPGIKELPIAPWGTDFAKSVWKILCEIPYGSTITYGEIAKRIARQRGLSQMSAQAVGGAVGRNPIAIIIPCHRVIGVGGKLTGYAGGIEKKLWLLQHEHAWKDTESSQNY